MLASELEALSSSAELARKLEFAAGRGSSGQISLGVVVGERFFVAGLNDAGEVHERDDMIALGCLMKLLTATLVVRTAGPPAKWRGASLAARLSTGGHARLGAVTFGHLLNHTHGLDDSLIWTLPRLTNGSLDAEALCAKLTEHPPLGNPGELQSYGSAGAWLWAAALESGTGATYAELLYEQLLEPLSLASVRHDYDQICPAGSPAGAARPLKMSVMDLLHFLQWHMTDEELAVMRADAHPLPGWAAGERGTCQGWKQLGDGWYGHNSISSDCSALVRMHPSSRIGIVFAGSRTQAFATFARLFARVLPEFKEIRPPKEATDGATSSFHAEACEGIYSTGALQIVVSRTVDQRLRYQATWRTAPKGSGALDPVTLRAANRQVFFPEKHASLDMPFLQFIRPRDGRFEYLWNGKNLWRRR